ncbi:LysR substrate-binding domain-containing protein [Achromobacter aloeverae]|uniref:LysR family transcriptional regulator n=1 Tax=Achromobacter aloeverae TaxID=1750518 RepID=A0A4Q1HUI0_9BURK|nr:LysR substrate-binding domain-containing protein [Achromobacter aloeverae]RXN93355.1 LysR family transcriptional regulator [Achromobacter aloeverae]
MSDKISRMSTHLPLNAVRAFLAAARRQSFTLAATDLHVTHGAVSRQIKSLEAYLGVPLFERRVRQVRLTAAGQQFLAEAGPALDQVAAAARQVMAQASGRAVRINARPTFAVRWLIPRLSDFVAQYPGIEPQILTSIAPPNVSEGTYDIAIRRGLENWPDTLSMHPFLEDEALLVGAPRLMRGVTEPADLSTLTLLSAKTRRTDWEDWKKHVGIRRLRPGAQIMFDHSHFVLQAAIDGLGYTIAPVSLLANDLAEGRLACPFPDLRLPMGRYYYGVDPSASSETHLFSRWLDSQARQAAAPA